MKKHLFVLLACLFVVMIGFGITLPVMPFYVERLALEAGATQQSIVLHVTLLTGVYALMQLVFAPLWGRWSDRIGRRPLILIGLGGYVIAQVLFGLSTSLWHRPESVARLSCSFGLPGLFGSQNERNQPNQLTRETRETKQTR